MAATYQAEAKVTGARDGGRGTTKDGKLDLNLQLPVELGGRGGGTNPEELFAVGYAACFASVIAHLGEREGVGVDDVSIDAKVALLPDGGRFKLGGELHVHLPSLDQERAAEVVRRAHTMCPYSRAVQGNVDVALTVNGTPLEAA